MPVSLVKIYALQALNDFYNRLGIVLSACAGSVGNVHHAHGNAPHLVNDLIFSAVPGCCLAGWYFVGLMPDKNPRNGLQAFYRVFPPGTRQNPTSHGSFDGFRFEVIDNQVTRRKIVHVAILRREDRAER